MRRWLDRHPKIKGAVKTLVAPLHAGVSSGYAPIPPHEAIATAGLFRDSWRNHDLPLRQRRLVDAQLLRYRNGEPNRDFDALVDGLRGLSLDEPSLLEVGCASGYYSEVLPARGIKVGYRGCDYSVSFVALARRCYPSVSFDVADAIRLPYRDDAFDVVVSGCCLLHIPEYAEAIAETARVARHYVILHRTPVFQHSSTTYFTKKAYGTPTVEIHFNESELVRLAAARGLHVVDVRTINSDSKPDDVFAMKTYVCRKGR